MPNFPVQALTAQELQEASTPQTVRGGNTEAVPWELFQSRTYLDGVTTQLIFFNDAPATPRLGNVGGAGLPAPQYFQIYYAYFTVSAIPGATGAIADTWFLLNGLGTAGVGVPTWRFELADKKLGPFPLTGLHARGGVTGFNGGAAATTEYANNAQTTGQGTFCFNGSIIIPPVQGFSVTIDWPEALTLAGGDTEVTVSLAGSLHRRIL